MSYATMPTFEGNYFGVRRLSTLGNAGHMLGALGDITGDSAAAVAAGVIDQGTANFLIAAGATDQDFIDLLNGSTDVPTLMVKYTTGAAPMPSVPAALAPAPSTGINPTIAPPPPAGSTIPGTINYSVAPAQVPAGSTLNYTAAWDNASALAAGVLPKLVGMLPSYALTVLSSSVTGQGLLGPSSIQLLVQSQQAHAQISDVASILNGLLQQLIGGGNFYVSTPQLTLVSSGPVAGASAVPVLTPAAASATATSWVETNWPLLLAGGLAAIVIGIVFEKRV